MFLKLAILEWLSMSMIEMQRTLVMSELDFAAEVLPSSIKVLGVTGTNGKSTVTSFAGQVFQSSTVSGWADRFPVAKFIEGLKPFNTSLVYLPLNFYESILNFIIALKPRNYGEIILFVLS